jgi:hypothetical protein
LNNLPATNRKVKAVTQGVVYLVKILTDEKWRKVLAKIVSSFKDEIEELSSYNRVLNQKQTNTIHSDECVWVASRLNSHTMNRYSHLLVGWPTYSNEWRTLVSWLANFLLRDMKHDCYDTIDTVHFGNVSASVHLDFLCFLHQLWIFMENERKKEESRPGFITLLFRGFRERGKELASEHSTLAKWKWKLPLIPKRRNLFSRPHQFPSLSLLFPCSSKEAWPPTWIYAGLEGLRNSRMNDNYDDTIGAAE